MTADSFDAVVIGGGIAGATAAYHLSPTHRVVLVEAAPHLAFHSTGRSAALLAENYGGHTRPMTRASRDFFVDPPSGFTDTPLVSQRGVLWIAGDGQLDDLAEIEAGANEVGLTSELWSSERVREAVPVLRPEATVGAVFEPGPLDIDVAALHQGFVRGVRRAGGEILTSSPVTSLKYQRGRWEVTAGARSFQAPVVVNAAGAWGDMVARLAGLEPVGLVPMRRTAFMVGGRDEWSRWPMVINAGHHFYFKPDGAQLLCSPADETPTEPGDAKPDPMDVALAIERINAATDLDIRSVRSEWAGLRTFAPDRSMVIGPDPAAGGFMWLVGQGGTGIQTSPAAGELVASLVRGEGAPARLAEFGVDVDLMAADRFR